VSNDNCRATCLATRHAPYILHHACLLQRRHQRTGEKF
jgi:hypothetical protein